MWEMIYNYNFLLNIFYSLFYTNVLFKICLSIVMGQLVYRLYVKEKHKNNILYKYKIFYNIINISLISLYLIFNIYFLLYIRNKYITKDLVLVDVIKKIMKLCTGVTTIDTLLLISLIILTLCLFIKCHLYFKDQLIKRHLILFYNGEINTKYLIDKLYLLNIHGIIAKIILLGAFISHKYKLEDKTFQRFVTFCRYIFLSFPTHFIISFFFYEILFNQLILSPTFNKALYFYVFYTIYKRICNYYLHTETFINKMLYNMYYKTDSILYVNLPKLWEDVIHQYVFDGLQRYPEKSPVNALDQTLGEFEITINSIHTFTSQDKHKYINSQGDYFFEEK